MKSSVILGILFLSALTLTAVGCSTPEKSALNTLLDTPAESIVEEDRMEKKTDEKLPRTKASRFVYLKYTSNDYPPNFFVHVYQGEPNPQVLTTVNSVGFGASKAQLIGMDLYYLNNEAGVSYINLKTLENTIIPIPRLDLSDFSKQVSDFEVAGDSIFYLIGGCTEGFACEIHTFNTITQMNDRVYDGMRASPVGGISLLDFDAKSNTLLISDGWGDAGLAYTSVNQLDLSTGEYEIMEEYSSKYCGEENEYCDDEQLQFNEEHKAYWDKQVLKSVTCGGLEVPVRRDEVFVGCL